MGLFGDLGVGHAAGLPAAELEHVRASDLPHQILECDQLEERFLALGACAGLRQVIDGPRGILLRTR
jgi:hypothetical protein